MAGKVKHAQRSMRSCRQQKYVFAGFNQFEKRINNDRSNEGSPLKLAMLVSSLMNGFKSKRQNRSTRKGDK